MKLTDFDAAIKLIQAAQKPVIIQAENPDADSLGSALALEDVLTAAGKQPNLQCSVDIPKYLRYLPGWDRVEHDLPKDFDLVIIVDTSSAVLLEKTLEQHRGSLAKRPILILDHHLGEVEFPLPATVLIDQKASATAELIFDLATAAKWTLSPASCFALAAAIIGDTGNLSYDNTTVRTFRTMTALMESGLDLATLHEARRKSFEKPANILTYKGELISRIAYESDGRIAHVTIPWEETEKYSDHYNPAMLVIEEMLLVDTVKLAVVFKSYPQDKQVTAKIRAKIPIAAEVAEKFGGGGHAKAAGCKVKTEKPSEFVKEFLAAASAAIGKVDEAI